MFIAGLGKTKLTVLLVHKVRSVPVVCIVAFLKTNNQYCEQTETCFKRSPASYKQITWLQYLQEVDDFTWGPPNPSESGVR